MKHTQQVVLYGILAAITIYGIVTGKFLFLVVMIPLSFGLFRKSKDD